MSVRDRERACEQPLAQALALQQLGDEEGDAALDSALFEDLEQMRIGDLGGTARLAQKAMYVLGRLGAGRSSSADAGIERGELHRHLDLQRQLIRDPQVELVRARDGPHQQ